MIVGLLSFYDEHPDWLTRCIHSLPVDHLIAIDGAYRLYPDGKASSPPRQHEAIRDAAAAAGIPLTLHIPNTVWPGEVEKRNHLFEIAETMTGPADWYFVIDADEHVTATPPDLKARLAGTVFDVGAIHLTEPGHPRGTMVFPTHPKFFRAIHGLRAIGNHYTYTTPDGRKLWGNAKTDRLEPRADLTDLQVMHSKNLRHPDRYENARTYYLTRDEHGIEDMPADRSVLAA